MLAVTCYCKLCFRYAYNHAIPKAEVELWVGAGGPRQSVIIWRTQYPGRPTGRQPQTSRRPSLPGAFLLTRDTLVCMIQGALTLLPSHLH